MSIYEKGTADVYIRNQVEGYQMLDGIVPVMTWRGARRWGE
jgi:hypothetical protein